ncbi:DegT/DnrJ/EryC1/StrS family aminotransferase [Granulicoccus sp. GXG6511]|uniref:DegT/DnrJ/EryC1/StrS family aminotransferase n=1 Tax=Granulicoccus sp. GXG6511 TaxID=3381351 RepID=UPI003D7E3F26
MITDVGITPIPVVRPILGAAEQEAVAAVMTSGQLVQGAQVAAFEAEFAELVDGRHCVAVSSGTSALHLALMAAGIGRGDEVIVPSFTFAATANAVRLAGADPVFADIDPGSFCLDPEAVSDAIGPRTAAIMPVHLFGHAAEMASLTRLAERYDLLLVEDAAQAHAGAFDGQPVGALGDLAGFSFYATKNMTTGEGGMVVTKDGDTARRVRLLRNQGMEERYLHEAVGLNQRMTDVAAAIGREQLRRLADWTTARRRNAAFLDRKLRGVTIPRVVGPVRHVYHQYTVRHPERDVLIDELARLQIGAAVHYPRPTHLMPAYAGDRRWSGLRLEHTERACAEVVSLPVRPDLTESELQRIVAAVNSFGSGS